MIDRGASLIIGADGLLGSAVAKRLRALGQRTVEARRRPTQELPELDIGTMSDSWPLPADIATAYFCAAVTSQHVCETSFDWAYAVNVTGTVNLIRRLRDAGVFVVFPSTNLVFDGSEPCVAADAAPCPRTAYGRMKADAEARLLKMGGRVAVVRLTKVVHGQLPIVTRWREELGKGRQVHPFHDMYLAPLALSDAVTVLIETGRTRTHGILQASATEDISYAQACRLVAERYGYSKTHVCSTSWRDGLSSFGHVPEHTTLDTSRARDVLGFEPLPAATAFEKGLDESS